MRPVLLISHAFSPDNAAAAARPAQLHRYLPEFGYCPFVVTAAGAGAHADGAPFVVRVPEERPRRQDARAAKIARWMMRYGAPYDDRWPWVPHAVSAAVRLIERERIAAVYSTSPFLASHFAACILKRKFGLPWIADFQDPILDNPFRTRRWYYPYDRWVEGTIFHRADRLLANTDTVAAAWRERYPRLANRVSVLWNSFDPEERIPVPPPMGRTYKSIVHVGSLYGGRHPADLLESFRRLQFAGDAFRLKLVGPVHASILAANRALFEEMRRKGVLEYENKLIAREDALRLTAEADYLLLLDLNEKNASFQVPSKLLDYVRVGKPILAYTPSESPVERILEKSGIRYEAIDPSLDRAGMDRRVQALLQEKPVTRQPSAWFQETFDARRQAGELAAMLETLSAVKRSRRTPPPETAADIPETAGLKASMQPVIVTTIDAEEAFDWSKPFERDFKDVSSLKDQYLCHRIFERYGVIPIYLATYSVAMSKEGASIVSDIHKSGLCEVGAQLHPWVTPPMNEDVNVYNSFPGNLPRDLEFAKLKRLTEAIEENLNVRPRVHRAGRYGLGRHTMKSLRLLGYRIDTSIVPEQTYRREGGPTFFGAPADPFWVNSDRNLLELPLTSGVVGNLTKKGLRSRFAERIFSVRERHAAFRSLLGRLHMIERIRLTPEGTTVAEAKRLVHGLLSRGVRCFTLSYHTPSLVPGNTPYVRSERDRERFLDWLDAFYEFFLGEIGGKPMTTQRLFADLQGDTGAPVIERPQFRIAPDWLPLQHCSTPR